MRRWVEWTSVRLRMGRKPVERRMRFAVRSGPVSRPTAAGNTLIAAGNTPIDSGNTLIAPRDSLAKSGDFGQGRK